MTPKRRVEGVGIDDSWQYWDERPAAQGETVDVVDEDLDQTGEISTDAHPDTL